MINFIIKVQQNFNLSSLFILRLVQARSVLEVGCEELKPKFSLKCLQTPIGKFIINYTVKINGFGANANSTAKMVKR